MNTQQSDIIVLQYYDYRGATPQFLFLLFLMMLKRIFCNC